MKHLTMRIRYRTLGGHTHMSVFAGMALDPDHALSIEPRFSSLGKCGDLVMRNEEFAPFRDAMEMSNLPVQFVEEPSDG